MPLVWKLQVCECRGVVLGCPGMALTSAALRHKAVPAPSNVQHAEDGTAIPGSVCKPWGAKEDDDRDTSSSQIGRQTVTVKGALYCKRVGGATHWLVMSLSAWRVPGPQPGWEGQWRISPRDLWQSIPGRVNCDPREYTVAHYMPGLVTGCGRSPGRVSRR